ncbi:hypothetical protein [Candidatus Phytoplasma fraxini]|uniref:hypothetical protein n=1 Tax=Ash yellows phytoplasma TaxID=35780 RepID=UPI0030FE3BBD
MLPSDLDEALETQIGQPKTSAEIKKRREVCEEEYLKWKEGTLKYLADNKDMTTVQKTYVFTRFNGLDKCQYPDKVPKDLAPFIREPFDNWYYTNQMPPYKGLGGIDKDYFISGGFHIDNFSKKDSKFNDSFLKQGHTIEMDYEGPKYLLEEDKDFYVNEVKCPLQEDKRFEYKSKTYYLHFNPKQQYITLYTEKMNTKEK